MGESGDNGYNDTYIEERVTMLDWLSRLTCDVEWMQVVGMCERVRVDVRVCG